MNEFVNMPHAEQLSALLDGEFEVGEASTLFFELAQNTELQDQFRSHIMMKRMFGKSLINPPDHLKRNIVIGSGLASTGLSLGSLAYTPIGKLMLSAFKSRGLMLALAGIAGSLATILYMNIVAPMFNKEESHQSSVINRQSIIRNQNLPDDYLATVPDNNSNANSIKGRIPVLVSNQENDNEIKITVDVHQSSETKNNAINQELFNLNIVKQSALYATTEPTFIHSFRLDELPALQSSMDDSYQKIPLLHKFSLQVRHFTMASIPQINLEPLDRPTLNNIGLSLVYHNDKNISAGIEVGQESIMQKYQSSDDDSLIQQNYTAFWAGALMQYTFGEIPEFAGLQPFLRGFIGGTRVGPFLKGMFGMQYELTEQFYIFGGFETSLLYFRYQGDGFTTQKFGATYGMYVRF